jgi:hypothetical protein
MHPAHAVRYASRLASRPTVLVALALHRAVAGLHRASSTPPRHAYTARRGGRPARHLRAAFPPVVVIANCSNAGGSANRGTVAFNCFW